MNLTTDGFLQSSGYPLLDFNMSRKLSATMMLVESGNAMTAISFSDFNQDIFRIFFWTEI
jgi:hypothetical protein